MNRCHDQQTAEDVGRALRLIPARMRHLVACEFVIGVAPQFAGIHHDDTHPTGADYRTTAHAVYPYHQLHRPRADRSPKVVLPALRAYGTPWTRVGTVVHELGHVLDLRLDFAHTADPVTEYAKSDRYESFAEAFEAWVWGRQVDDRTQALFDGLPDGGTA